jgi:hypothetical protein
MAPRRINEGAPLEPRFQRDTETNNQNTDPVRTNENPSRDGTSAGESPWRWLDEDDSPQYPSGGNPASGDVPKGWDETGG